MFIEKITLENLASLKGCWTIDFTAPEYESGIFAVTGTNGAGKSTIMDAICLALYGECPRKTVTSTSNEIMTKGTSSCLAEVLFRTSKGRFAARWKQSRARAGAKKPFSQAVHEFEEIDGPLCVRKSSETKKLVEKHTGLTFEQFTQSAMLAQFQFEKFLTAGLAERTAILETLTGTARFREMTKFSKEINSDKKRKIENLENVMKGKSLRTSEEMARHEEERHRLSVSKEENRQETEKIQKEIESLGKWNALQKKIAEAERKQKELDNELTTFQPERQILEKGLRAKKILSCEETLRDVQKRLGQETSRLETLKNDLAECSSELKKVEESERAEKELLERKRKELEEIRPKLQRVREWDKELQETFRKKDEKQKELSAAKEKLEEAEKGFNRKKSEQEGMMRELNCLWEKLPETERSGGAERIEEHSILKFFGDWNLEISRIIGILEDCQRFQQTSLETEPKIKKEKQEFSEKEILLEDEKKKGAEIQKELEECRQNLEEQQKIKNELWKSQIWEEETKSQSQNIQNLFSEYSQNTREIRECQAALQETEKKTEVLSEEILVRQNERNSLERELQGLHEILAGVRAFKNFEEERAHLHEGKPCPLCGALEHPFASSAPNDGKNEEKRKNELEKRKKELVEKELPSLNKKRIELARENENAKVRLTNLKTSQNQIISQLKENWRKIAKNCGMLNFAFSEMDCSQETLDIQILNEEFRKYSPEMERMLEGKEKQRSNQEVLLKNLNEKIHYLENQKRKSEENIQKIGDECNRWNANVKLLEQKFEQAQRDLSEKREKFREEESSLKQTLRDILSIESLASLQEFGEEEFVFSGRREVWVSIQEDLRKRHELLKKIQETNHSLKILELEVVNEKKDFESAKANEQEISIHFDELGKQYERQKKERFLLFKDENPDAFEEEISGQIKSHEENLGQLQEERARLSEKQTTVSVNLSHSKDDLQGFQKEENRLINEFQTRLQEEKFADEEEYEVSKRPDSHLKELQEKDEEFKSRQHGLNAIKSQNEKEFKEFGGNAPTEKSERELEKMLNGMKEERDKIVTDLGKIEQIFDEQKRLKLEIGELDEKIHKAKEEAERWSHLCEVLGPESSTKNTSFVNFVQSITFNNLLYYANQQLKLLNPRYQLKTCAADPNELQIVDSMHEAAIRSPSSLSGGEKFTLSLALALGLTKLASRNVEINSFFIDEGFGSLASETLENALDALKRYQANARRVGKKLIGIISHVDAVQNEIDTLIELTPYAPHHFSRITGPGVSGSEKLPEKQEARQSKRKSKNRETRSNLISFEKGDNSE